MIQARGAYNDLTNVRVKSRHFVSYIGRPQ